MALRRVISGTQAFGPHPYDSAMGSLPLWYRLDPGTMAAIQKTFGGALGGRSEHSKQPHQ
jgi:hypothetical protein